MGLRTVPARFSGLMRNYLLPSAISTAVLKDARALLSVWFVAATAGLQPQRLIMGKMVARRPFQLDATQSRLLPL